MSHPVTTSPSGRTTRAATPETLMRDAMRLLESWGNTRSPAWASKVTRSYLRHPAPRMPFSEYLAERLDLNAARRAEVVASDDHRRPLGYADPTADTAIRHVDRARRRRPDNRPH